MVSYSQKLLPIWFGTTGGHVLYVQLLLIVLADFYIAILSGCVGNRFPKGKKKLFEKKIGVHQKLWDKCCLDLF